MKKRWFSFFVPLLLFLSFAVCMAFVQFASPDLPDNDGYYHIKMAYIMRTEGVKPKFPWLPLTILNEAEFYDHHFLFHIALIPFTFGDLRLGAKWAAVIFASLAFLSIWYLFYRQHIPLAWLWALALLAISEAFLYRMSITRAQSLSLAILVLGLTWMLEGKYLRLAGLAFIYVWLYDAFPLLPAMAGLYLISSILTENRFEYRPFLFIAAGTALGMLINPYFPDNLTFTWRHIAPKLTHATSVSVGNEWYPYDTGQLLKNSFPALFAFCSGVLALGLAGRKMNVQTGTTLLAAFLFGLMLFQARRFVEYFPPFALIFAAFAWTPLLSDSDFVFLPALKLPLAGNTQHQVLLLSLASAILLTLPSTLTATQSHIRDSKPFNLYEGAAEWLANHTQAGERVFQTDWDDFPRLFYFNTHNTYLVGLDPTYLQLYDKELYDLWVLITRGKVSRPSQFIANQFKADYVQSDLKHNAFLRQAAQDDGLREVYRDDQAVLFEVIR